MGSFARLGVRGCAGCLKSAGRGFSTHEYVGASVGTGGLELRMEGQQPATSICQVLLVRDLWTAGRFPVRPWQRAGLGGIGCGLVEASLQRDCVL